MYTNANFCKLFWFFKKNLAVKKVELRKARQKVTNTAIQK